MPSTLSCYYLDTPLDEEELSTASRVLLGHWATFRTGAERLLQKRVPAVLPVPDEQGAYAQSREERAHGVRLNLRHAGIGTDRGRQVVWVTPQDSDWDAIFQFAIRQETGYAPFVAQRWFVENGVAIRRPLRIVDTQMLWRGL